MHVQYEFLYLILTRPKFAVQGIPKKGITTLFGNWKVSLFESLEDKVCGDEANGEAAPDEHTHQKEAVAEG